MRCLSAAQLSTAIPSHHQRFIQFGKQRSPHKRVFGFVHGFQLLPRHVCHRHHHIRTRLHRGFGLRASAGRCRHIRRRIPTRHTTVPLRIYVTQCHSLLFSVLGCSLYQYIPRRQKGAKKPAQRAGFLLTLIYFACVYTTIKRQLPHRREQAPLSRQ